MATATTAGRQLWALDQYTGATRWGPLVLTGTYGWIALASGEGSVFALSDNGTLVAFNALDGRQRWISQVGSSDSAPTVTPAGVFLSVNGAVRGVDPATGATRWTRPVANGDTSSPAVSGTFFSVSYACNTAYGFSTQGVQRWRTSSVCTGGGGKTAALYQGRVYTRDSRGDLVFDAADGRLVGTHGSRFLPAFLGDLVGYRPIGGVSLPQRFRTQQRWQRASCARRPTGQWSALATIDCWSHASTASRRRFDRNRVARSLPDTDSL